MQPSWADQVTAVSTSVGTVAVIASAIIAFLLYLQTQQLVARKEALESIRRQMTDRDLIKLFRHLAALLQRRRNDDLRPLCAADKSDADRCTVVDALNYYEMLAIGIRVGAIDSATYKLWWRSGLVQHFVELQSFVEAERQHKSTPTAWIEFHSLAIEWAHEYELARITIPHPDDQAVFQRIRGKRKLSR
ncbi:MAG TPA: DUF4760 domain-containing protein [Caulobacterales bacterium]|nr:DUF4760 domain-containing protein [Caulobacterales bacterium]